MATHKRTLLLFDVDGTLTASRQKITDDMSDFMVAINKKVCCGLVGGSDLEKIMEQMGGKEALDRLDYVFAENGLAAYKKGETIAIMSLIKKMGEEKLQELINFALCYLASIKIPVKRGTFIEFRNGMLNFCPVGRSCSQQERNQFAKIDQEEHIRETMVTCFREKFGSDGWVFSIGGQISIDAYPTGWDKRYCLQYVENDFDTIHFFGDKVEKGGNDHEIYEDPKTIGHKVISPEDTKRQVSELLGMA